jgi:glutaredoxin|tara:strand:+ start:156 stop:416 length:261 start_codon:yes stop_codon:yes gene_type:complete
MEITIYTNEGCIWCSRTKELMARASVEYTEVNWQKITVEEQVQLKEKFGDKLVSFPVVVIDDEFVGGLVETAKIFLKKGLVSARQG